MILQVKALLENMDLDLLDPYLHSPLSISVKCKKCNTIYKATYCNIYQNVNKCPTCYPSSTSIGEMELASFVKDLDISIERNIRTVIPPHKLDIYIPTKNMAIEYNGLYWHSEAAGKSKMYHIDKLNTCLAHNIRLIQIFEDEWKFNKELTKKRIEQILGISKAIRLHARKCFIREMHDITVVSSFLQRYHSQGFCGSKIKLGAFFNNELIAIMTFSLGNVTRGTQPIEGIWELSRFCSNYNYHIPGIASKLLAFFQRNYKWTQIFSYADRRWSVGNLYRQLGFTLNTEKILPSYWYIKGSRRIHRSSGRKRPNEPKNITEAVLRAQEGYVRIWDCGHLKFVMRNENYM